MGALCAPSAFAQTPNPTPANSSASEETAAAAPEAPRFGLGKLADGTFKGVKKLRNDNAMTMLALGGALAASATMFDKSFSIRASSTGSSSSFRPGAVLGGATFQFGASAVTYGIGRLTGNARVASVGGHLLQAQAMAQGVTHAIKYSVRRMRPDGSTRNSFPSGHTSVSFASATVLQREFGWKVGAPAYVLASYVGYARIQQKRHYLSDVVLGAAIGIVAGRSVGITIADKRFDVSPVTTRGGGAVNFVWTGR
jgi:membrane-associated phospholipid phosphatase